MTNTEEPSFWIEPFCRWLIEAECGFRVWAIRLLIKRPGPFPLLKLRTLYVITEPLPAWRRLMDMTVAGLGPEDRAYVEGGQ